MRVRYTAKAIGEIEDICRYIAHNNPKAAENVAAAIARTIEWDCKVSTHAAGRLRWRGAGKAGDAISVLRVLRFRWIRINHQKCAAHETAASLGRADVTDCRQR